MSQAGVTVQTSFYFPPPPAGRADWKGITGATAPLKHWDRTVISGLVSEPIVLEGYYSQTYCPEHHNEVEHFLFEPRLEPGLSPKILDELATLNVRYVYVVVDNRAGGDQALITTYGF